MLMLQMMAYFVFQTKTDWQIDKLPADVCVAIIRRFEAASPDHELKTVRWACLSERGEWLTTPLLGDVEVKK